VLMDLGFVTHAIHANSRLVHLVASFDDGTRTVRFMGPPNGNIYPPGPGWVYCLVGGVPSKGVKVMVGNGQGPLVDEVALSNVLDNTNLYQYGERR